MARKLFKLEDPKGGSPTMVNLRWNALLAETDWSDDDLDAISSLRREESYTTPAPDSYRVTRQNA